MQTIISMLHFISVLLLCGAALLTLARILVGPTLPDRVVAIDLMSILVMCIIAIYSVVSYNDIYLDIIIALALVTFLGTIAFAQFIEWQLSKDQHE